MKLSKLCIYKNFGRGTQIYATGDVVESPKSSVGDVGDSTIFPITYTMRISVKRIE